MWEMEDDAICEQQGSHVGFPSMKRFVAFLVS